MAISPKDRIIFALDVPDVAEAARFAGLLKDHVGMFKIGLELFVACGPEIVKAVREKGGRGIFLDLKFHDIPETIKGAMRQEARRYWASLSLRAFRPKPFPRPV